MAAKFSLLCLTSAAFVKAVSINTCGITPYNPETHVCYWNYYLCPIISGEAYSFCGGARGQCYSTFKYQCLPNIHLGNSLVELDRITTSFELFLSNPKRAEIDGLAVHASGHKLITGPSAATRTYCEKGLPEGLCDTAVKDRTLLGVVDGMYYMKVMVPGGQAGYLSPNFTEGFGMPELSYTQAHSARMPEGSLTDGFIAYKNGGFFHSKYMYGWQACGSKFDNLGIWNIFPRMNDQPVGERCVAVNLRVRGSSVENQTAWTYT